MPARNRDTWTGGHTSNLPLQDGARVGVVGGGPAGSFFSYFLLSLAERVDLRLQLDVYEPRDFTRAGPPGCNMCGGIISESLVQVLAAEGLVLPPSVVQRGIESYILHTDEGSVRIETPLHEKRIGAVHRGRGPKGAKGMRWESFDGYLQGLAREKGANIIQAAVGDVGWKESRPRIATKAGSDEVYDLLVVAAGVNSRALALFQDLKTGYVPPRSTKSAIREFLLGEEQVDRYLGNAMHVFLLDIPRLEFGAIIPKGDYVTVCLLGEDIDAQLVDAFLDSPEVRACLPPDVRMHEAACQCWPNITTHGAVLPYADRIVFVGDCSVPRLYKDGIGAAYRMAKAAAATVVLHGVSAADFELHYWPTCRSIGRDNLLGKAVFAVTGVIQGQAFTRRALVRMVSREQTMDGRQRHMSTILWDLFTGSAPYREALLRGFHPAFIGRLLWHIALSLWPGRRPRPDGKEHAT